jgi:two-component system, sensor histidine kinase
VLISVIDNGTGIADEHQDLIFEEFRQVPTKERNKPKGTGLRLALTKKFVRCTVAAFGCAAQSGRFDIRICLG